MNKKVLFLVFALVQWAAAWEMVEQKVWWDPHDSKVQVELQRPISELQEVRLLNSYKVDATMVDDKNIELVSDDLYPGWNIIRIYCTLKGEGEDVVPQLGSANSKLQDGQFPPNYAQESGSNKGIATPLTNNPTKTAIAPHDPNIRGALPGKIPNVPERRIKLGLEQSASVPTGNTAENPSILDNAGVNDVTGNGNQPADTNTVNTPDINNPANGTPGTTNIAPGDTSGTTNNIAPGDTSGTTNNIAPGDTSGTTNNNAPIDTSGTTNNNGGDMMEETLSDEASP